MEGLTPAKLRYLLTISELSEQNKSAVRCIDVAVRLGVARASVCRMLSSFVRDGLLIQDPRRGVHLSESGRAYAEKYGASYHALYDFFKERFGLSDFDAGECAMSLLSSLSGTLIATICERIAECQP